MGRSVARTRKFATRSALQVTMRRFLLAPVVALAALALTAAPSSAIVGGHDAAAGAYPSIAEVHLGKSFLCTGTLIAPTWVLTAGHCGSVTGAGVATPASWPAPLIDVYLGSNKAGQGTKATVAQAIVEPSYLATSGYDITLLKLASPAAQAPTKVANDASIWTPGTSETIAGWGTTSEGGSTPSTLQEAQVPITTDAYCAGAYSDFDARTMVCAGFPQGGVDTCQGDSGGPLWGHTATGALKVVGATSFGEGCARAGKPGVYARVADTALREWIRSQAPDAVD
jgi:secreted trypsin-like serine protease